MPHGDFSDMAAFSCAAAGLTSIFAPDVWFASAGPLKPMFEEPATPALLAAIQCVGALLVCLFPILYVVRWNTLNGKAAASGCLVVAANLVSIALRMDDAIFVLRGWYVLAALFVLAALHLAFNANPMLTSAMLLEKEKARAAKAK